MRLIKSPVISILIIIGCCCSALFAQSDRGTIRGTVTDSSGAVLANARVILTGTETGETRETTTSDDGIYVFPELRAAVYQITVEAQGFQRTAIEDFKVAVQVTHTLDIQLQVGEVTGNTVTINAESETLQSDTSVRQTNVTERQVRELPLLVSSESGGRTPLSFIFLDSNVSSTNNSGSTDASRFRVSGGQGSGVEILIDGASVRRTQNGNFFSEVAPGPNAFQEFTISTNSYSAEFGNSSGGVVNFTQKSGTNEFHGEAYDFIRNEVFNARDIDSSARGRERNRDNQNDYGFNIGGPIYIPGFGEGTPAIRSLKDRAFFFFNYEGYRFRQGSNTVITVPTLRMRNGDFSELLNTNDPVVRSINGGNPVLIYDPRQPSDTRTAFAGNIIPGSAIDPAGLAIIRSFPLPTRAGLLNNYDASGIRPTDMKQFTVKTDFVISNKQTLTASYSRRATDRLAGAFPILPLPITNFDVFAQDFKSDIFRLQDTYTVTSNVVNFFNVGFTYFDVANSNTTSPFNTASLGIPVGATQNTAFPRIDFPGYGFGDPRRVQNIGSSFFTDQIRDQGIQLSDSMTVVKGRQTIKFGADIRINQFNVFQDIDPGGAFNFRNDQTTRDDDPNGGYPLASLVTGATEFAFQSNNSIDPAFRQLSQSYFVQDDVKLTQKLTLNLGLRYDIPGLRREGRNQFRGFDPTAPNPQAGGRSGALVGAAGQSGLQAEYDTLAKTDYSNIGPRIGAAYAFNNKTVIRGGIGLYYAPVLYGTNGGGDINTGTIGYNTTGVVRTPNGRNTPANQFLSTFRNLPAVDPNSQFTFTAAQDGNLDVPILAFGSFNGFRTGRTLQYTVDIQRELPFNFFASIGYIGHRADRLRSNFGRPNALPFDALKLGNEILRTNINDVTAAQRTYATSLGITIPASGNAVYPGFGGGRATVAQALRPFPQYGRVTDILESDGESDYNAVQLKLERRFTNGIQFGASYTFSKLITNASEDILGGSLLTDVLQNPYDTESLKTISPSNSPHVFVTNFLLELPFGRGKKFLNKGGIVDKIFGGFQVSGIFRVQQGTPLVFSLDPGNDSFLELAGIFGRLRPNLTGQPLLLDTRTPVPDPTGPGGVIPGRFFVVNPAAFSAPPSYNAAPPFLLNGAVNPAYQAYYSDPNRFFGTAPLVNQDVRSDPFYTQDLSILKKIRFTETVAFELGAELFNVFNNTLYLPPDTFLGRAENGFGNGINPNFNFGAEGFTARLNEAGNRVIQLRLRVIF